MKRSTVVAIVIIILSIAIGGVLGFYFYLNSKNKVEETQFGRTNPNAGSFGTPNINTSVTVPGNASTTQPEQIPEITGTTTVEQINTTPEIKIPDLRQIYSEPVSGISFFMKDIYATTSAITESTKISVGTTSTTSTRTVKAAEKKLIGKMEIIQFLDRATGHMYEAATSTLENIKVSNTTVPKIYEALILTRETLITRGLYDKTDIIETKFGKQTLLTPTSTEKTLLTQQLTPDIREIALSPNKSKIFYLQNKAPLGIISNVDGTSAVTAFESAYREWLISWPTDKFVTLTTKPSAYIPGFMYTLNTSTKALQKVLGGINGLTTLTSPNGQKILYNESKNGSPNLFILNTADGSIRNLFFRTFTDKCVWSKKETDIVFCAVPQDIAFGDYPDAWYQGIIFFTDDIWKINTKTGETKLIAKLNELSNQAIDVTNPTLNSAETFLVFNNKIDLSLWGLKTVKDTVIATTTVDTATPSTFVGAGTSTLKTR